MITSISNNIGIEQVSFKDYQRENLTVLNGQFEVDPSSEAWKSADEIVFEFSSLLMRKSADTCVYLIDSRPFSEDDKAFRGTVLRSRIAENRLHIEKADAFDEYGPLRFIVCSAYAKGGQRTEIVSDGFVTTGISGNFSGTVLNKKCLMVKEGYVFCLLTFKKFGTDGSTLEQAFDITGMPADVDVAVPVIYSNGVINTKGHPLAIGHISNGHFTCTNPDSGSFTANDGTFLHFFAVRDGADDNTDGSDSSGSSTDAETQSDSTE